MAGDWIKMRSDLAEDPSVICIAGKLGLDEFAVVGRLQFLWAWFDGQSRDGHARGVTQAWVNRKVQCDGFAEAMAEAGWLIVHSDGIEAPKFDRHNGDTAKTRALGTKRKQKERSRDEGHGDVAPESCVVSRTERDKSETREEKRREELSPSLRSGEDATTRKRAAPTPPVQKPEGVDDQTWSDWLALRAKKRAPVTLTVLAEVAAQAAEADVTLQRFLSIWCSRGSQGLQASWLKPNERGPKSSGRHSGFASKNYSEGIGPNGELL